MCGGDLVLQTVLRQEWGLPRGKRGAGGGLSSLTYLISSFSHWALSYKGGFFHRYPTQIIFHQNARTLFCQNELAAFTAKYFGARQNTQVSWKMPKDNLISGSIKTPNRRSIHAFPGLVHRSVKNVCNQWSARWHILQMLKVSWSGAEVGARLGGGVNGNWQAWPLWVGISSDREKN